GLLRLTRLGLGTEVDGLRQPAAVAMPRDRYAENVRPGLAKTGLHRAHLTAHRSLVLGLALDHLHEAGVVGPAAEHGVDVGAVDEGRLAVVRLGGLVPPAGLQRVVTVGG